MSEVVAETDIDDVLLTQTEAWTKHEEKLREDKERKDVEALRREEAFERAEMERLQKKFAV